MLNGYIVMKKLLKYVIVDIIQNKIVLIYTALLLVISFSVFNLEDNSAKGLLSLLNIILIIVPLDLHYFFYYLHL